MTRLKSLLCLFHGGHAYQPYTRYSTLGIANMKVCRRCGTRRYFG